MAKKKTEQEPKAPKIKRVFKPEKCPSHKFIVESDGRVDMLASHEVTDDSICFNCGLYFSTWMWYSDEINASFWKGVDNEAGQAINYVAKELAKQDDRLVSSWGELLLEKLRERRKKNGQQRFAKLDNRTNGGHLRKTRSVKTTSGDGNKDG